MAQDSTSNTALNTVFRNKIVVMGPEPPPSGRLTLNQAQERHADGLT